MFRIVVIKTNFPLFIVKVFMVSSWVIDFVQLLKYI